MRREMLWRAAPPLLFVGLPVYVLSIQRAEPPNQGWLEAVVVILAGAFLVPAFIFIALSVAKGFFALGAPRQIRDVDRSQRYTALGYGCLVASLTLVMATTYPAVAGFYGAAALAWALWCVPQPTRRLEYRLQISVRCSPQAAFELVSSPRNWHRYLPELDVLEPVDTPVRAGSLVHTVVRQGWFVISGDEQVIEYEPGRRFGTADTSQQPAVGIYEFSPAEGGTEIVWTYWSVMPYSVAVLGGALRRRALIAQFNKRRLRALQAMKALLEAPAPLPV